MGAQSWGWGSQDPDPPVPPGPQDVRPAFSSGRLPLLSPDPGPMRSHPGLHHRSHGSYGGRSAVGGVPGPARWPPAPSGVSGDRPSDPSPQNTRLTRRRRPVRPAGGQGHGQSCPRGCPGHSGSRRCQQMKNTVCDVPKRGWKTKILSPTNLSHGTRALGLDGSLRDRR